MKRVFPFVLILCLFSFVLPANALPRLYLGLDGGISLQKPSFSDIEFNTDTTFLFGANLGIRLGGLGLEVSYFQAAHNLEPEDIFSFDWGERKLDFNYIGLNVKIGFPLVLFSPYFTVGYGYYTADLEEIAKENDGGFNLGAGVDIFFGKHISLAAEGKYHRVGINLEERKFGFSNFTFSAGLNFYF
ncbi:MAG: outer membrane beta-barrel protein [Candidatus Aminicenantia bacterium]